MLVRKNPNTLPRGLKLKAVLLSTDGGESWVIARQHYLTRLDDASFLDDSVQGMKLQRVEEDECPSLTPNI